MLCWNYAREEWGYSGGSGTFVWCDHSKEKLASRRTWPGPEAELESSSGRKDSRAGGIKKGMALGTMKAERSRSVREDPLTVTILVTDLLQNHPRAKTDMAYHGLGRRHCFLLDLIYTFRR